MVGHAFIKTTLELTNLPNEARPIGVKWVYKKKTNVKGQVEQYKARLIVKAYKQKNEIDYEEAFALVIDEGLIPTKDDGSWHMLRRKGVP